MHESGILLNILSCEKSSLYFIFFFTSDGTHFVFLFLPVVSLTSLYYVRHKKVMVCREGRVNQRKHSVRTRPEFVCFFP